MQILSVVFIFLILLSTLDLINLSTRLKKNIYFFVGILFFILSAFRYGDRDYFNYVNYFDQIAPLDQFSSTVLPKVEVGFLYLISTLKTFDFSYHWLFYIISFISISLFFNYTKNFKYRFSALLIYFSHLFMSREMMQIRAGLSANILLYSYKYIQYRNFKKFFLVVCLASLFHYASLLFLVLYFIYPFLIKKNRLVILIISGFIFGLILNQNLILALMNKISFDRVSYYIYEDSTGFEDLGLLNPVLIKNMLIFFTVYKYREKLQYFLNLMPVYLFSMSLSIFWLATFNNFSIFAGRIASMFSTVEIFLLPCIYLILPNRIIGWFVIVLFTFITFYSKFETFENLKFFFQ